MAKKSTNKKLTPRELEIVKMLANGMTNKQIASVLGISPKTSDVHKTNAMGKLDIHNRALLTLWAVRNKLIEI